MPFKIPLIIFLLFLNTGFSFGQKSILDYYNRVFPNGVSFEQTVTDTFIDLDNNFFEYTYKDGNYHPKLFQAKLIEVKKGNDILMFVQEFSDMQCSFQKQWMFEIDKKTDSLISIPFLGKFEMKGYEYFVEADSIEKNIFRKYTDSLKTYLHSENNMKQFLEELYDYKFELAVKGHVWVCLRFCDYIPTNIVGFTEEELEYLRTSALRFYEFKSRKRNFKEIEYHITVKF